MDAQTDAQLLRAYAERRSDAAFAELVRRHIDLVHSAARRMVGDTHLAEDVTQATFLALAKNAAQLTERTVMSGWLHRTAQNIAAQTVRTDVRRRAREQEAAIMNELLAAEPDAHWEHIAPHLDSALGELNEPDRDALLLRYFEKKSAHEMAQTLGISDEAAQKRVSRAVERLREFFAKRGVTVGASGLAVVISANAVQAAPVGLAVTISTAATLAGTTLATTATVTATKAIAMTTLQKTLVTATIAVLAGVGIYEARQAAQLHEQVQVVQQQQAPLAQQNVQLSQALIDATNHIAGLQRENERLNQNMSELLKLRGEVRQLRELAQPKTVSQQTQDPIESEAKALADRVNQIKNWLAQSPAQAIPELQLLSNRNWLEGIMGIGVWDGTERQLNFAASYLRQRAKEEAVTYIGTALANYAVDHEGQLPNALSELRRYLRLEVTDDMLARYELLHNGNLSALSMEDPIITEKTPIHKGQHDAIFKIGAFGYSYHQVNELGSSGSGAFSGVQNLKSFIKK